ncbi:DUF61 family protein [Thermococcus argininiproducens]|uniref:UPF0216 protein K1720_01620 n=1 Tax=Thermococcus argininiproducens TaxID=2866384 RepID=A0A9E7MBI0_9EURY|nr:DUF61 family protein [Thermococcus argininiproducens]USH00202.1 DUF61 family protein [Thermococcus argininiproducens]
MPKDDEIIQKEISRLNVHLPKSRKKLAQLLKEEEPKVQLRDGQFHYFKREELEYILSLIEEHEREFLYIPIILEITTTWHGYFRVRGKVAVKIIEKILGNYDMLEEKTEIILPRYLLPKIRKKLPTTTTYAFIVE